jgi:MFS family permease
VLATRSAFLAIGGGVTGGLGALFVKDVLGADAIILGLFSSIWSAVYLVFILVGGWIGDRYDRKKMLLIGTALTLPNPIIYAVAPSWHLLILANFLGALGSAVANPAYIGILYGSVNQRERSRAIATLDTLSSLANLVVPPLGAYVIEVAGGLGEIRKMFALQFVISLSVWMFTYKKLKLKSKTGEKEVSGFTETLSDIFSQMKSIYRLSRERKATSWLYIQLAGPFAWELVGPFWIIFAADVCMHVAFNCCRLAFNS